MGVSVYKAGSESVTTHTAAAGGYVRDMARVRVGQGMAGQNYCVVGGCLLSLSLCRRGFQDLLKVRPFFLFTFSHMDTPTIIKFSHYSPACI
jgi:hypothetical protein